MLLGKFLSSGAAAAALILCGGTAQAATQIVNVSSLSPSGTVLNLAAGTYSFRFIGIADGGAYDAWSPWGGSSGCDSAGMNCSTGYTLSIAVDFGLGTSTFNHVDGFQYGQLGMPGNNHLYQTAADALSGFDPADLIVAALPGASDINNYSAAPYPMTFTLNAAQAVNFFILDYPYGDNRDGISLLLDDGVPAVPEPASWAMMILGMGIIGAAMRRQRLRVAML